MSSMLVNGPDWVAKSHFRWAQHDDSADAFWRDGTQQVRSIVEGLLEASRELEVRLQAGLDREKLMESEIERLRKTDGD